MRTPPPLKQLALPSNSGAPFEAFATGNTVVIAPKSTIHMEKTNLVWSILAPKFFKSTFIMGFTSAYDLFMNGNFPGIDLDVTKAYDPKVTEETSNNLEANFRAPALVLEPTNKEGLSQFDPEASSQDAEHLSFLSFNSEELNTS
ncbi:hypothetical protein ACH5RR_012707 [Cinchona calisaya]|uniref:Uncharacterized protein n=1 Tax=Cinchona calisaya TaxID=153742 RepID=A0ABD3A8H5_9GENT